MGLNPKGRNWGNLVNWDSLGKFYAAFTIIWTFALYAGVAFLVINRRLAFIKIRNLPLAIAAVSFLHVYLVKILLAYTTNGHFTCSAEYWIMSIYLPFGIALFQANLAQLRSISDQQRELAFSEQKPTDVGSKLTRPRQLWLQWTALPRVEKTYFYIGVGMVVQLLITGILYGTTPTLRDDWSSYGDISHAKGQLLCRKSLEWIPTAFWQMAFSYVFGPYLIFMVRNIHDVHHWRLQVIISVIAGLPGAPLWLAAVFSDGFKEVNRRWVPPMWIAPGIIVMQFTTIFFPVYEILQSRQMMRKTLAVIESWEDRRILRKSDDHASSTASTNQHSTTSSQQRELFSMAALDKALAVNPDPLLKFAATKDFTAENVLFLMQVRRWKEAFARAPREENRITESTKSRLFNLAVDIYTSRVNDKTSTFPINIDSRLRQELDAVFMPAVPTGRLNPQMDANYNEADSWHKSSKPRSMFDRMNRTDSTDSAETLTARLPVEPISFPSEKTEPMFPAHPGVTPLGEARSKMRAPFDEHVYDAAEDSIKYLVLTNTWQKFVREHRTSFETPVPA